MLRPRLTTRAHALAFSAAVLFADAMADQGLELRGRILPLQRHLQVLALCLLQARAYGHAVIARADATGDAALDHCRKLAVVVDRSVCCC